MGKPLIIVNLGFKKRGEAKSFRNLLKYLQNRDGSVRREAYLTTGRYPEGVSDAVALLRREPKWVDRGMGEGYKEIVSRAYDWQGRRMLARTWVISPDPDLMRHVPEHRRFEVVRNVTEKTVERWYSDNGWGTPEYSFVLHDKHRSKDGMHMPHAHVITPATIRVDEPGELGRIDHIVKRAHIRDLHHTAGEAFEQELGRVLGRERAREVITERDARLERERNPGRERRDRMNQLRAYVDIMQILQAEKSARDAKKRGRKRQRFARQRMAELRMLTRYVTEDRRQRREADYLRMRAARRQEFEQELAQERESHRQRVERIRERGRRIPAHAEFVEQEEQGRLRLQQYYAELFAEKQIRERELARFEGLGRGREIER